MPESPLIIACNTTPLIALLLLGRLDLLRDLYGKVIIPPAVRGEFLAGPPQIVRARALRQSPWIQTVNLRVPHNANLLADLDRGEAEAITLAQEQAADLIIIDEKLGGTSPEEIAARYRTLTLEQVYATITYYLHKQEEIDRYLERWRAYSEAAWQEQQRNPPEFVQDLRERMRRKREELLAENQVLPVVGRV